MGRPRKIPRGQELIDLVEQHPDKSYPQIIEYYGWGIVRSTLVNALKDAGYRRYKPYLKGDGPLSEQAMSHEDFWGQVDLQMAEYRLRRMSEAEYRKPPNHVRMAPRYKVTRYRNWAALGGGFIEEADGGGGSIY